MHVAFVVSNPQLVRNYFFDANKNLLNEINYNKCTIICTERVYKTISTIVNAQDHKIKSKIEIVVTPEAYKTKLFIQILFFIFESTGNSSFLKSKFYTYYSKNEISIIIFKFKRS